MPWIILGLLALGANWAGNEIRGFERGASREIASLLNGSSKQVTVRTVPQGPFGHVFGDLHRVTIHAQDFYTQELPLFTEPEAGTDGKIGELVIELDRFQLGNLRVKRLEAHLFGNRFDFKLARTQHKVRLSRSGAGPGEAEIEAKDIAEFIPTKIHEILSCQVEFKDGRVRVSGEGQFAIIRTHFVVTGSLAIKDGAAFYITDPEILFDGRPADPISQQSLLRLLNPVVDLNRDLRLHGAIQVARLEFRGDTLVASGTAHIPALMPLK